MTDTNNDTNNETRLAKLEALSASVATREWVRELMEPMKESVIKIELATTALATEFKALFAAHSTLLQERSEREREVHEAKMAAAADQTWHAVLTKKVGPVVGVVMSVIAFFSAVAAGLSWWIVNQVLPHAPKP